MKKDNIEAGLAALNKKYGDDAVYIYKDRVPTKVDRLPTGSIGLDLITGGGWAKGLINYVSGWESSGKSTLALYAIASCQSQGEVAAYIDHEYSFDKTYAESLGVDVDSMILAQPDSIEQGYDIMSELLDIPQVGLTVFDSIAGASIQKDLESEVEDKDIGTKARLNSKMMGIFAGKARKNNTTVYMVNQLREKIGVMFGSPVTEPGGNALRFWPSIKVELRQSTKAKEEGVVVGNLIKAKCTKNKTYRPFLETEYHIEYGLGIDRMQEILDWGESFGIIKRAGSWYSYDGTKLGQGAKKAKELFMDNPELVEEIENKIYSTLNR
jgi:recombination protein RecA